MNNNLPNQLNIKNLIKTKWDKQFTQPQLLEIKLGLINNIDVSYYANPEFSVIQMEEIRLGLYHNIDVSIYADPKYNWKQMEQIRLKLERELNND